MEMRDKEIKDKYLRCGVAVKILAELNTCEETRIREVLERQGVVVPTKERKKKI